METETMTAIRSNYANILKNKKILFMPSCLVVEMMTRLYSQVSMFNLSGSLHNVAPDLLILLRRMTLNLRSTSTSYRQARIRYFIGDWKDDKLRARKLFFNLMSRLGYISELLDTDEKGLLYKAIEEMTGEWTLLDQILEDRCNEAYGNRGSTATRYFRNESPSNWQYVMAKTILSLATEDDRDDPDTYLILLCYTSIRESLMKVVEEIERKTGAENRLSPSKILCVSDENIAISCPKCTLMTDSLRRGTSEIIHKGYGAVSAPEPTPVGSEEESTHIPRTTVRARSADTQNHTSQPSSRESQRVSPRKVPENTRTAPRYTRYVMPPSLAGISDRK